LLLALACAHWAIGLAATPAALASIPPDEAVERGREAMNRSWFGSDYPWYDPDTDDLRPVKLPSEPQTPKSSFSFNPGIFGIGSIFQLLAWLLVLVIVALIAWLLIKAYASRDRAAQSAEGEDSDRDARTEIDRVEALPFKINRNTTDLLAEARRNYEAGNYAEAIIYLFSHELVLLDRNQLIRLTKGKTNRQYLREILPLPAIRRILAETMVAFEDVFFGNHGLDRERFEACWFKLDEFNRLVQQGARA
jgi:hypothetical protein